ncbi:hypothetical protein D9M71_786210 [compost metagenome]
MGRFLPIFGVSNSSAGFSSISRRLPFKYLKKDFNVATFRARAAAELPRCTSQYSMNK